MASVAQTVAERRGRAASAERRVERTAPIGDARAVAVTATGRRWLPESRDVTGR